VQLHFTSEYADHSSLVPSRFTTMAHTARRFLRPSDEATRHALLPSSETYTLHGSAEPSTANVLLSMRANSHSTNMRIVQPSSCRAQKRDPLVLRLMSSPDRVHPLVTPPQPSDLICSSHALFLFMGLISPPSNVCLRDVACSHETEQARPRSPRHVLFVCYRGFG